MLKPTLGRTKRFIFQKQNAKCDIVRDKEVEIQQSKYKEQTLGKIIIIIIYIYISLKD